MVVQNTFWPIEVPHFCQHFYKRFVKFWVLKNFLRAATTQVPILSLKDLIASYGSLYELW